MRISETILRVPYPVRLDKKTIAEIKKIAKKADLPFSTMLRVLILEALRARGIEDKTSSKCLQRLSNSLKRA